MVHGDIKPENVLVFKDSADVYIARIADFGYSTRFTDEDELIALPHSWPWYAPEHNERDKFKPAQARKTDIFSLGMLCLWVLFEKYLSGMTPLPQESQWAKEYSQEKEHENLSMRTLQALKQDDKLALLGQQLVQAETDLDKDKRHALAHFLSTSLACNPDKRNANLARFTDQTAADRYDHCLMKLFPLTLLKTKLLPRLGPK